MILRGRETGGDGAAEEAGGGGGAALAAAPEEGARWILRAGTREAEETGGAGAGVPGWGPPLAAFRSIFGRENRGQRETGRAKISPTKSQ